MDVDQLLELLLHGNQLKRTARTGWVQRGVPLPENVAAHTFGVVYATLLLAEVVEQPIDLAAALAMAALHDLPEGLTTDIPTPAWRFLPSGAKTSAERQAMAQIAGETPTGGRLLAWWEELLANETAEAHLVHDADKLDQYLQAVVYEQQTGNRLLQEFWLVAHRFHTPQAQAVYDELRRRAAVSQ
jgi:putative hydrolase of HD superfamily